jgi:hypothetical protein
MDSIVDVVAVGQQKIIRRYHSSIENDEIVVDKKIATNYSNFILFTE